MLDAHTSAGRHSPSSDPSMLPPLSMFPAGYFRAARREDTCANTSASASDDDRPQTPDITQRAPRHEPLAPSPLKASRMKSQDLIGEAQTREPCWPSPNISAEAISTEISMEGGRGSPWTGCRPLAASQARQSAAPAREFGSGAPLQPLSAAKPIKADPSEEVVGGECSSLSVNGEGSVKEGEGEEAEAEEEEEEEEEEEAQVKEQVEVKEEEEDMGEDMDGQEEGGLDHDMLRREWEEERKAETKRQLEEEEEAVVADGASSGPWHESEMWGMQDDKEEEGNEISFACVTTGPTARQDNREGCSREEQGKSCTEAHGKDAQGGEEDGAKRQQEQQGEGAEMAVSPPPDTVTAQKRRLHAEHMNPGGMALGVHTLVLESTGGGCCSSSVADDSLSPPCAQEGGTVEIGEEAWRDGKRHVESHACSEHAAPLASPADESAGREGGPQLVSQGRSEQVAGSCALTLTVRDAAGAAARMAIASGMWAEGDALRAAQQEAASLRACVAELQESLAEARAGKARLQLKLAVVSKALDERICAMEASKRTVFALQRQVDDACAAARLCRPDADTLISDCACGRRHMPGNSEGVQQLRKLCQIQVGCRCFPTPVGLLVGQNGQRDDA